MATKANITIDQGTEFNTEIILTDDYGNALDLSRYTAKSQLRKSYSSSSATDFTVYLHEGKVTLSLNSTSTASLTPGRYVYDAILTNQSLVVTRIVEGIVTVTPRVSK
jgi:hypothetical protein